MVNQVHKTAAMPKAAIAGALKLGATSLALRLDAKATFAFLWLS